MFSITWIAYFAISYDSQRYTFSQGSFSPRGCSTWYSRLPWSKAFLDTSMKLTPDCVSPLAMAWKMGEPPRYLGMSEGCARTMPLGNNSMTFSGIMQPQEHSTPSAGLTLSCLNSAMKFCQSCSRSSLVLSFLTGTMQGMLFYLQQVSTLLVILLPGLVQWVTTVSSGAYWCRVRSRGQPTGADANNMRPATLLPVEKACRLRHRLTLVIIKIIHIQFGLQFYLW